MQRLKYHRGSIYCTTWSEDGRVIATGSNDTAVHLLYVDPETGAPTATTPEGSFIQLTHHDGTVRDVAFMVSGSEKTASRRRHLYLLLSHLAHHTFGMKRKGALLIGV